jgi:energy-coupling factor transport system substrate-specific component
MLRKTIFMILLSIVAACLNIFFNLLTAITGIPLFLDTIMTIAITLSFGPVWGVITGTLTNFIQSSIWFHGWAYYLFFLCNIATALIVWLFMRLFPRELDIVNSRHNQASAQPPAALSKSRRLNVIVTRVSVLVLLSFTLCFVISIMGGLIAGLINIILKPEGMGTHLELEQIDTFQRNIPILKEILNRIPVNVADRLISVFAGYGIALGLALIFRKTSP